MAHVFLKDGSDARAPQMHKIVLRVRVRKMQ
jgi:hypothetical protein